MAGGGFGSRWPGGYGHESERSGGVGKLIREWMAQCAFSNPVSSRRKETGYDEWSVQGRIAAGKPMGREVGFG